MRISEVARRSGVSARMLRHYDRLGVVRPSERSAAGYREYSQADMWRLLRAEGLRSLGLGLQEVRRTLDEEGDDPGPLLDELIERAQEQLAHQRDLLARLEQLAAAGPADWTEALDLVQLMKRLGAPKPESRYRAAIAAAPGASSSAAGAADATASVVGALLAEPEPEVASALRWALLRGDERGILAAVERLDRALGDPDPAVRERAVRALSEIPAADATPPLLRALADPDPETRGLAALALGTRGGRAALAAVPALIEQIADGRRDVAAAEALGSAAAASAAPDTVERVVHALAARADAFGAASAERQRIAQALAELPAAQTGPLLDRLAEDADRDVARIAAYVRSLAV
ncbi:MerR family transcriptional regulator [Leucobacter zeae]|nr:MerR family transcriptional regulator [Leucobacter zeae]